MKKLSRLFSLIPDTQDIQIKGGLCADSQLLNKDVKSRLAEVKDQGFTSSTPELRGYFSRHPSDLLRVEKLWFKMYSETDSQLFGARDLIFYVDPQKLRNFEIRLEEMFHFKNQLLSHA